MRFRAELLAHFARNGRDLPWRRTRDPYRILVSEVMLQQTQVSRVVPAYRRFLRRFPTLRALARASLGDVLREWSGLGYNRRARDLHRIARACADGLPRDVAALDRLSGIGRYTAGAVACFSSGAAVAFADTNVRRVLGRAFLGRVASDAEARRLDAILLPRARAAEWHQALMDVGATICLARAPRCARCPVAAHCAARDRPVPPARRRQPAFAGSARRLRGRIVALLRSAPEGLSAAVVRRRLRDGRVGALASVLAAEGLIERSGRRLQLPR